MNKFWMTLGLFTALIVLAAAVCPERELHTEISIDAPPSRVWAVLTDTSAYKEWNPFIVSMKGEIVAGAILENTIHSDGVDRVFTPTVLVAQPNVELRWLGRLFAPRIFDGEHSFVLKADGRGGTHFIQHERFRGVLLWMIDVDQFTKNFEAMNAALKARAESRLTS